MARLFNIVVFNQTIVGDNASPPSYYTSPEHNAILGSADALFVEIIVDSLGTLTTQVTVDFETSNTAVDGEWGGSWSGTTAAPPNYSSLPVTKPFVVSDVFGAFGRFKVTSNDNAPSQVRVVVCGRSNG